MLNQYFQLATLIFCLLALISLTLVFFGISYPRKNPWFFVWASLLGIGVQWLSDLGSSLSFWGYYLHLASVVLFPPLMVGMFLTFILLGIADSRRYLIMILITEVGYIAFVGMLALLGVSPSYLALSPTWWSNHLFSSLAVVADYVLLSLGWRFLHNQRFSLPLWVKVLTLFWGVFILDSLVFSLGAFFADPNLLGIIKGNLVVRTIITFLLVPAVTYYLSQLLSKPGEKLAYYSIEDLVSHTKDAPTTSDLAPANATTLAAELAASQRLVQEQSLNLRQQRLAMLNLLEDVEQEKLAAVGQAQELRKFRAAAEQSGEMMVITDPEGIVLWVNPASTLITGFTAAEATGRKAGVLWGKLMPKEWYQALWHTIKVEKKMFVGEILNHRKSGEHFYSSISIYPLLDEKGGVQFFVGIQRDITKEKEVDRMKTDFISLASHQLRTPLSAIKWFLEMLIAGDLGSLKPEQLEALQNVDQSNERMIALVNSLLNISRIESGRIIIDPHPTDLGELATDVLRELAPQFESKHQHLTFSHNPHLPLVNLDAKLIRQVLINLLTNAHKYTPDQGEITVVISTNDTLATVQISDNGYGIPSGEQGKVYNRFFRASNVVKQVTDGTGLGLYLAKAIVESSGGEIWFKSQVGVGTSFWFTIPLKGVKPKEGEVSLT